MDVECLRLHFVVGLEFAAVVPDGSDVAQLTNKACVAWIRILFNGEYIPATTTQYNHSRKLRKKSDIYY